MVMSKFLIAATAATFTLVGSAALAQQDNNNPAPSYAKVAPVQGRNVQHIQDGNNLAPRYAGVAAVKNQNVRHIQDGNNVAPRYPAVTSSGSTARRRATHG